MSESQFNSAFERYKSVLAKFASDVNGELIVRSRFTKDDIHLAQSTVTEALTKLYEGVQQTRRKKAWPDLTEVESGLLDSYFMAFSVSCEVGSWTMMFDSICVPRAFFEDVSESLRPFAGLPLTVTCNLKSCKDFAFYMTSGNKTIPAISIAKGRSLGKILKPFMPNAFLRMHEMASRTAHAVPLATSFLKDNYYAESTDPVIAGEYINDASIRKHLLRFPITSINMGPTSPSNADNALWQLCLDIDGKSIDPLQTAFELTRASLFRLEELNLIRREVRPD